MRNVLKEFAIFSNHRTYYPINNTDLETHSYIWHHETVESVCQQFTGLSVYQFVDYNLHNALWFNDDPAIEVAQVFGNHVFST